MVNRSSAHETAVFEKRRLFRRRVTAENFVPVRKAAELLDDVVVDLRPMNHVLVLHRPEQLQAFFLVGEILTVLERHVEETAQSVRHLLVEAALDRARGYRPRLRIVRESARRAAKHVAGKLIEQEYEGKRAFGVRLPLA